MPRDNSFYLSPDILALRVVRVAHGSRAIEGMRTFSRPPNEGEPAPPSIALLDSIALVAEAADDDACAAFGYFRFESLVVTTQIIEELHSDVVVCVAMRLGAPFMKSLHRWLRRSKNALLLDAKPAAA